MMWAYVRCPPPHSARAVSPPPLLSGGADTGGHLEWGGVVWSLVTVSTSVFSSFAICFFFSLAFSFSLSVFYVSFLFLSWKCGCLAFLPSSVCDQSLWASSLWLCLFSPSLSFFFFFPTPCCTVNTTSWRIPFFYKPTKLYSPPLSSQPISHMLVGSFAYVTRFGHLVPPLRYLLL